MPTLVYSHPTSLAHQTPDGHPERIDRIRAVHQVISSPLFKPLVHREAPLGTGEQIIRAHTEEHYQRLLAAAPEVGFEYLDSDTVMSAGTLPAVLRAVGGACAAVDAVMKGDGENAFVAMRPPGHHAEHNRAMGFCFFNQAAIAALHARAKHGAQRVAVIDFDVHHGNGTQDIFWSDENLFYGSTHQMPLYPGTGSRSETGVGNIFNAPLKAGDGGVEFREAMNSVILPALNLFEPELLIISAGFDAHVRDPLGSLELVEEDFAWATLQLMEIADTHCDGKIVSVLEGGYDLQGLAGGVGVHLQTLMHGSAFMDGMEEQEEDDNE
ncbi:histone deacetylase family protein [Aestuariivirga litoralis]|uniref:histone deacetylase family protein n=1 Tax=Aestuariivirga litoralis TaxID=2650924 RepID=UPI0018C7B3F9|nr:histone deacetylase family protein [Aestuariivirga litoralis]MBG1233081.1 histone deacetylase family protein [Aestuariivirga litoralis]